jgi:hypothetical protein
MANGWKSTSTSNHSSSPTVRECEGVTLVITGAVSTIILADAVLTQEPGNTS